MKGAYHSVPSLESDGESQTSEKTQWSVGLGQQSTTVKWLVALNGLFFLGSCGILLMAWTWTSNPATAMKLLSPFSPILNSMPLKFHEVTVRGALFDDYDPHVIYRQPPSEEVDKAWDVISDIQYIAIDEADMRTLGKDPSLGVKFPEEWGLGSDKYMTQLDSQHQLHCLNQLRMYIYFDHYYGHRYTNLSTMPVRHQAHISHCLDILLQTLTCMPSLDLITHQWMETQDNPYPDFNIKRQCVNHDAILEWQEKVAVKQVFTEGGVTRPPGAVEVPAEATIWKIGEDLGS